MTGPADPDPDPAAAGAAPDRIFLRDHVREIEIGAFREERGRRQRVRFTLEAALAAPAGPLPEDDVDAILSYDVLTGAIDDALAAGRFDLLETLAERIAARVLAAPQAAEVLIRIEKLDRVSGTLGIEIRRAPAAPSGPGPEAASPTPRVVFLGRDALAAPDLAARLDRIAAGRGAVLCVDAPAAPAPLAATAAAQWAVDLLALEQSAWQLAARDPRCIVAATRTELEWGLREGRLLVWAPAKLVLDAGQTGPAPGTAPRALAAWLAALLGAPGLEDADAPG